MQHKDWMALPLEERTRLAELHGLPKNGNIQVVDNVIVQDGYLPADLLRIPGAELPVAGTESPIVHFNQNDSLEKDPTDTRNQNKVITQQTVDADQLVNVVAPAKGEATATTMSKEINATSNEQSKSQKTK